jgi:pimeloyl-ACP methyl ester carboxylesterase
LIFRRVPRETREFTEYINKFGKGEILWDDYKKRLEGAKKKAWFSYVEHPNTESAPRDDFYASSYGRYYDPTNDLKKLRIPVLAIYGLNDKTVPPEDNSGRAIEDLRFSSPYSMVIILPKGDHRLNESKTGSDKELIDLNTYVQGYFELVKMWLRHIG